MAGMTFYSSENETLTLEDSLPPQRTVFGVFVVLLIALVIFSLVKVSDTDGTAAKATTRSVNLDKSPTGQNESNAWNEKTGIPTNLEGLQCSAAYIAEGAKSRLKPVGFCKIFMRIPGESKYNITFGKYFTSDGNCYGLANVEFMNNYLPTPWYIWLRNLFMWWHDYQMVLPFEEDRFLYLNPEFYPGSNCNLIPFNYIIGLNLTSKSGLTVNVKSFVLSVAVLTKSQCQNSIEVIPALYSFLTSMCHYGAGLNEPLKSTQSCRLMCDRFMTADEGLTSSDPWYLTNQIK